MSSPRRPTHGLLAVPGTHPPHVSWQFTWDSEDIKNSTLPDGDDWKPFTAKNTATLGGAPVSNPSWSPVTDGSQPPHINHPTDFNNCPAHNYYHYVFET